MSCYEWERGDIKMSVKEYSRVKKAFIESMKKAQEDAYNNALKLYNRIIETTKGKRGVDFESAYHNCQYSRTSTYSSWGSGYTETNLDKSGTFYSKYVNRTKKPLKPKKKDYITKVDRKNVSVDLEDAYIGFRDSSRTITWEVSENNHAKEHAHAHPLAKTLFNLLHKVEWTRGTGGTIVGNDEYNRDDSYAGGGGNYITMSFGPLGKDARRDYARSCY
jgi:hypothetical protein